MLPDSVLRAHLLFVAQAFIGTPHRETTAQRWESTMLPIVSQLRGDRTLPSWLWSVIAELSQEHRRVASRSGAMRSSHCFRIVNYLYNTTSSTSLVGAKS